VSDDAKAIARAALAEAIASCAGAWQERWHRAPTTNELAHAFEVCLRANADDLVSDVGAVLAMSPASKPPPSIDFDAFEVVFRDTSTYGVPEVEIYAPKEKKDPGRGELRAYLDARGDTLTVDVAYETYSRVPTFALACDLVIARVLHRWIARRDLEIARVVFRALHWIDAPVTIAWPPPDA